LLLEYGSTQIPLVLSHLTIRYLHHPSFFLLLLHYLQFSGLFLSFDHLLLFFYYRSLIFSSSFSVPKFECPSLVVEVFVFTVHPLFVDCTITCNYLISCLVFTIGMGQAIPLSSSTTSAFISIVLPS